MTNVNSTNIFDNSVTTIQPSGEREYFAFRTPGSTAWTYCTDKNRLFDYVSNHEVKLFTTQDGKPITRKLGKKYTPASEANKAPSPYNEKFGNFGIVHSRDYVLYFGKSSRNKNTKVTLRGDQLVSFVREKVAHKFNSFSVLDGDTMRDVPHKLMMIVDDANDKARKTSKSNTDATHPNTRQSANSAPAPVVDSNNDNDMNLVGDGNGLRVQGSYDRDWYWFALFHNGKALETNDQVSVALNNNSWARDIQLRFGVGPTWSKRRKQWSLEFPTSTVSASKMHNLLSIQKPKVTETPIEEVVTPIAPPPIAPVVTPVTPVQNVDNVAQVAINKLVDSGKIDFACKLAKLDKQALAEKYVSVDDMERAYRIIDTM